MSAAFIPVIAIVNTQKKIFVPIAYKVTLLFIYCSISGYKMCLPKYVNILR